MRILHTSDWHLGKRLYKLERLAEQSIFLDELLGLVKTQKVDHLLVAGDVFDVPQPPHKALKLFYDFISRLLRETNCELWVIGGNHDSGHLLDAPQGLIDSKRVHLFGTLRSDPSEHWVRLPMAQGYISLCLLPYFRQHDLSPWKSGADLAEILKNFFQQDDQGVGRMLMAHHLFGISEAAGSEQALALSGLESIPLEWLEGFDYVALGHIHKPQTLKKHKPLVRYCGSPLPMRFSETAPKGVELIEWTEQGMTHTTLPLPVIRPLHAVSVSPEDWQKTLSALPKAQLPAALEITLKLQAPVPGLIESIRNWGEEQGLEILSVIPHFAQEETGPATGHWTQLLQLTPEKLFEAFYLSKFPKEEEVPRELTQDMKELWEEARHAPPAT
ncbi:MAG: exonuclease SbcCD subunit D [Bacteriovoracia bacterium]